MVRHEDIMLETRKYFTKISAEDRNRVSEWLETTKTSSLKGNGFLNIVREALQKINYDFWIATIEPSAHGDEIYYSEGEEVAVGFSCNEWVIMASNYSVERGSRLASALELFLWYALRIAEGKWSLEYVAIDSSSAGNFSDAPGCTGTLEKSGARCCGGYCDGQGNTYKIVAYEDTFFLIGSNFYCRGFAYPVAHIHPIDKDDEVNHKNNPDEVLHFGSGVVVLTK